MTDPPDDRVRQLMHELAELAPPSPDWDEVTVAPEPSSPSLLTTRGPLLLAAAAVLLIVAVASIVLVSRRDDSVTTGNTPFAPASTSPVTSPPATTSPSTAPDTQPATTVAEPAPTTVAGPAPGAPTSTEAPTTTSSPPTLPTEPVAAVQAYLDDLVAHEYESAARRLGAPADGLAELDVDDPPAWLGRADLGALAWMPDTDELAQALAAWCGSALCAEPAAVRSVPDAAGGPAVVAKYELAGVTVTATFSVAEDGTVRGLPPLAAAESLAILAAAGDAESLVARLPDGTVATWHDGDLAELGPSAAFVWSEGDFIFWQDSVENSEGVPWPRTKATRFDGTVVCEVDGHMHRLREDEGRLVASVERLDELPSPWDQDVPVPNYAVDCATGERTAIDPISWTVEGGSRGITRVADRTFTYEGDAEGNADVTNESGISINGDDYAGFHTYSPDGDRVVYADFTDAPGPHYTNRIRTRDTTTGELLWTADMPGMFTSLHHTDDRVLVAYPPPTAEVTNPGDSTSRVDVHDAETGRLLLTVPTVLNIVDLH